MRPVIRSRIQSAEGMPNAVVEFDEDMEFLSSALLNGGSRLSRSVMIMQVPKDHMCSEPKKEVVSRLKALGLPSDTVSFMTAAEVDYVFTESYASYEGAEMAAVVTAGLSNQVVAGEILENWEERHALSNERSKALRPGTINIIVVSSKPLTEVGKVNAIITATEAKTAALNYLGYKETGTTSDAVAIVSPAGENGIDFTGTGTSIGIATARAVKKAVATALMRRDDFPVGCTDKKKEKLREGI